MGGIGYPMGGIGMGGYGMGMGMGMGIPTTYSTFY